jgi:hypothetical protein
LNRATRPATNMSAAVVFAVLAGVMTQLQFKVV